MEIDKDFKSHLFVEGNNDKHVILALRDKYIIDKSFGIVDCGSIEKVFTSLELYVNENASKVKTIGIVIDADTDIQKKWEKSKKILLATNKYIIPDVLPLTGLVVKSEDSNYPTVGVWIMPDNNLNGMLEDFLIALTDDNDPILQEVDSTLIEIEKKNIQKYKPIHKTKAKIHTFLAWQEEPGIPMGRAITKRYLNPDSPLSLSFANWLKELFL